MGGYWKSINTHLASPSYRLFFFFFSLKFKVFNDPSVAWTCSIVPQQDVITGKIKICNAIIRRGERDNFPYYSFKTYVVIHQKSCLTEMVLTRATTYIFIDK